MLANRVREYTSTTGSGDITLGGALPAHITFGEAFGVGDSVTYVIEDGDNYEIGTGTLSAADTLVRTDVGETLVDGVYTKDGAVPITLSGNARVFCAATANFLMDPVEIAGVIREVVPGEGVRIESARLDIEDSQGVRAVIGASTGVQGNSGMWIPDGSAVALVVGSDGAGTTLTDEVSKTGRIAVPHFDNAQAPAALMFGVSNETANLVHIGGGSGMMNAATEINFYTAANNATAVGNLALSIDSTGTADFQGNPIGGISEITLSTGLIRRNVSNSQLFISGSTASNLGANIVLEGNAALDANDIEFRTGSTTRLRWDDSEQYWNFQGNSLSTVDNVFRGNSGTTLNLAGGSDYNVGGNIVLYGEGHATLANDILLRSGAVSVLSWDDNLARWDFQGNPIQSVTSIVRGSTTSNLVFSGGSAFNLGANIQLFAENHAIQPNDIAFRAGSASQLYYSDAASVWNFQDNTITRAGVIQRGLSGSALFLSGSTGPGIGAELQLFGDTHPDNANDILLRSGGNTRLQWDASSSYWTFRGSNVGDLGDMTLTGSIVKRSSGNSSLTITGGTTLSTGSNISFYGQDNDTNANDIIMRSGTAVRLQWDNSAAEWHFQGNDIIGVGDLNVGGKITVDGGAKISVQNKADGGSGHGIFLWDTDNTDWGIYMASAGALKSLSDGTSSAALDGRTGNHVRFRAGNAATNGFLWENGLEVALMSLTADTGDLYTNGDIIMGGYQYRSISTDSAVWSGGSAINLGGNIVAYGESHATLAGDMRFRSSSTDWLYWDNSSSTATFAGSVDLSNNNLTGVSQLLRGTDATNITISGGTATNLGANISLWGENDVTNANDIRFRASGTEVLRWDHSADVWNFADNTLDRVLAVYSGKASSQINFSGGTISSLGGNIVMYGETHSSLPSNIVFRDGALPVLQYGSGIWSFKNNNLADVGDISMYGNDIHRNSSTDLMRLSGGSAFNLGANIHMYGETHATLANDILFRTGGTARLRWDNSAAEWHFQGNDVAGVGDFVSNGVIRRASGDDVQIITGGPSSALGGNMVLWGNTHGSRPGDIAFRDGSAERLAYDSSVIEWHFKSTNITGVNNATFIGGIGVAGKITVDGGAKISVQNKTDGGSDHGIYWWDTDNNQYVSYMAQAGVSKSPANGNSTASLNGRTGFHLRSRVAFSTVAGFIWENDSEQCLMSLTADTGDLYTLGVIDAPQFHADGGVAASPSHTFTLERATGMYRVSSGVLGFSVGGLLRLSLQSGLADFQGNDVVGIDDLAIDDILTVGNEIRVPNGTASDPSYTFTNDGNTGIYLPSTSTMNFTCGGILQLSLTPTSVNFQGNDVAGVGDLNVGGKITVDGGAKISVQNKTDGGSGNGIYLWDTDSTHWGHYMATAGIGKSLADGTACSSLDGRTLHHIRQRVISGGAQGFIWENHLENCLMSLTADTGNLWLKGTLNLQNNGAINWKDSGGMLRNGIVWDGFNNLDFYSGQSNSVALSLLYDGTADFQSNDVVGLSTLTLGNSFSGVYPQGFGPGAGSRQVTITADDITKDAALTLLRTDSANIRGSIWLDGGAGKLYIDNNWDSSGGDIIFRVRTSGTILTPLTIQGSGNLYATGNIVLTGNLVGDSNASSTIMSGGIDANTGANLIAYGSTHPTNPNDLLIRAGNSVTLQWDDSVGQWDFHNKNIDRVGDLTVVGKVSLGSPTELTISSGTIIVTKSFHTVDTEADAATDDLDTINGGTDGDRLILMSSSNARVVVLKDGVGNLDLNGDFSLTSTRDMIELIQFAGTWREISRSNNA